MNIFRFLKSTSGAIKPLNALLISGAAGAVFFYTVNTAANKQIQAERAVRTLTSIEGTAPQQGMHRQGDLFTSINVRDGRNQLATAEERAAMKGNSPLDRYEANQRALDNMDGSLGRAAQFSESEGLNTGNRNAVQSSDRFIVGNPNAAVDDDSVTNIYKRRAHEGAGVGGSGGPTRLANASMTRASGNAFGGSSGAVSGGISAQGGTRAGGEGPARLSGAMPGGSNIVSQRAEAGLGGNNTSSFGGNRNARTTRSRQSGSDANELKDIVKKSAAAASNVNASANEGGRAFLASAVNSGGVSVTGAGEDPTTRSADFAPTDKKLRAIGKKLDKVQQEQNERGKIQNALIIQMIATMVGSIGMMVAGSIILSKLKNSPDGYSKLVYWVIAGAMMATVAAANAWLFMRAAKFSETYTPCGLVFINKFGSTHKQP
ncbi:MAG: hypothetical protein J6Q05_00615, partial [Elusimicrobiaceae bacterium]|nr:hypothetical protein [Elusimicrobiaceae bacterium]